MKMKWKILPAILMMALTACRAGTKNETKPTDDPMEKKVLVAYFSYSGVTRGYAEKIAKMAHADLFEIQAEQPYTDADVDWTNDSSRVNKEMKPHPDSRPAIARKVEGMENYATVFVGFPIWWYIAPNIINTFLESHNLKGKTIVPFFTSHSSGPGQTDEHLRRSVNEGVRWLPAVRANAMSDTELQQWVDRALR